MKPAIAFIWLVTACASAHVPRQIVYRWQFQFDKVNRLTNTITPLHRETQVGFDQRGLLYTLRQPSGLTTTNFHDPKGRVTNIIDQTGVRVLKFNANDSLTNIMEGGRSNSWTRDALERVSAYKDADGNLIQYKQDAADNLNVLTYPGGFAVTNYYNSLNQLTNVTDWLGNQTFIDRDLAGNVVKITRPNGSVRIINRDGAGEVANIVEKLVNNAPIAFFKLNWNAAGRVQWEFAGPPAHPSSAGSNSMTFDDDNRLATFNGNAVTNDLDGNMVWGPGTNSTFGAYSFNARNWLLDFGGMQYGYDPAGNRTSLTNGASVTKFIVDPNANLPRVLMRIKGGTTNYYIYGPGLLYEITVTATSTNTLAYHFDLRGSSIALTDGNGNVTDRIEYSAYGCTTYRSGTNETPFLFNGRYGVQTDPNGLLYMRARYYNPYICRFVNADPAGFAGGLNFYAAFNGNPVTMLDPLGLGATGQSSGGSWLQNVYSSIGNFIMGEPDAGDGSISFNQTDFGKGTDSYFKYQEAVQARTDMGRTVVWTAASLIPVERAVGAILGTGERAAATIGADAAGTESGIGSKLAAAEQNLGEVPVGKTVAADPWAQRTLSGWTDTAGFLPSRRQVNSVLV